MKNKLILENHGHSLKLHYRTDSVKVFYDICDQNGRIYLSGLIEGEVTTCSLDKISRGSYFIYIVDSGRIYKEKFII